MFVRKLSSILVSNYSVSALLTLNKGIPQFANLLLPSSSLCILRAFHQKKISDHMQLYTYDDSKKQNVTSVYFANTENRPLVLLIGWLMAKEPQLKKYVRIYENFGMDVLQVRLKPLEMLKPVKGANVVANEFLNYMNYNTEDRPILVHGFSVAGFLFGTSLVQMSENMQTYGRLKERFVGQIWDSIVDIEGIPSGFPKAVSKNKIIQHSLKKYLEWFLRANYETATKYYEKSSAIFHEGFLNVPGLFLFSKKDHISHPTMNEVVYKNWEKKGIPVFVKCFEKSLHVLHYRMYREEYEMCLTNFLEKIGLIHCLEKKDKTTLSS